ncbi:GntR family transcriptional regulator [Vibrio tritonius]|uniref:GntR family transcriptional regulator n=1 Tax=Vibrio tritonius TaxID=1435069 RepID=UPI00083822E9|nr:GntR family transcriptional regulator [Vibrio tritonius]
MTDTKTTRYLEVANSMEQQITDQTYRSGDLLPTEAKLCSTYQISRYTARAALKVLEQKGFIERHQGKGSVVINNQATLYRSTWSTIDELLDHAEHVHVDILAVETFDSSMKPSEIWFEGMGQKPLAINALRYMTNEKNGQRPLCTLDVWIHEDYKTIEHDLPKQFGSVITHVEQHFGVTAVEVNQVISAVILSEQQAKLLCVPQNQAALRIRRKYFSAEGKLIEASETVFPCSVFEYQMTMRRF